MPGHSIHPSPKFKLSELRCSRKLVPFTKPQQGFIVSAFCPAQAMVQVCLGTRALLLRPPHHWFHLPGFQSWDSWRELSKSRKARTSLVFAETQVARRWWSGWSSIYTVESPSWVRTGRRLRTLSVQPTESAGWGNDECRSRREWTEHNIRLLRLNLGNSEPSLSEAVIVSPNTIGRRSGLTASPKSEISWVIYTASPM